MRPWHFGLMAIAISLLALASVDRVTPIPEDVKFYNKCHVKSVCDREGFVLISGDTSLSFIHRGNHQKKRHYHFIGESLHSCDEEVGGLDEDTAAGMFNGVSVALTRKYGRFFSYSDPISRSWMLGDRTLSVSLYSDGGSYSVRSHILFDS